MKILPIFRLRKPKTKININSREFYDKHPDLAPRNIYLYYGRVITKKDIDRSVENFGEPFWIRAKNWLKYKIEDILIKNK